MHLLAHGQTWICTKGNEASNWLKHTTPLQCYEQQEEQNCDQRQYRQMMNIGLVTQMKNLHGLLTFFIS